MEAVIMRKMIGRNIRWTCIVIAGVLVIAAAYLFYMELTSVKFREIKVKVFSYSSAGNIDYRVRLKPNILYNETSLGEGEIYITEFVDNILANFSYRFAGDKESEIQSTYEIIAYVEGYDEIKSDFPTYQQTEGSAEQSNSRQKVVWSKEFRLVPETRVNQNGNELSVTRNLSLNYSEYNNFASKAIELSKFSVKTRLVVTMNVMTEANTQFGTVNDSCSQSLVIPLGSSSFQIIKNNQPEKPGALEETQKIQIPKDRNLIILYGAVGVVSLFILLWLIFLVKTKPGISEHAKVLNTIFRKYGNRLVALNSASPCDSDLIRMVRSIEDLVRIADEIQKPILYSYNSDSNFINRFFIYDDIWMYVFDIREFLRENMEEKSDTGQSDTIRLETAEENSVKA